MSPLISNTPPPSTDEINPLLSPSASEDLSSIRQIISELTAEVTAISTNLAKIQRDSDYMSTLLGIKETKFQAAKRDMLVLLKSEINDGTEEELARINAAAKMQPDEVNREPQTHTLEVPLLAADLAQEPDDWEDGGVVRGQIKALVDKVKTLMDKVQEQQKRNTERIVALEEGHEWMCQQFRLVRQRIVRYRDGDKKR